MRIDKFHIHLRLFRVDWTKLCYKLLFCWYGKLCLLKVENIMQTVRSSCKYAGGQRLYSIKVKIAIGQIRSSYVGTVNLRPYVNDLCHHTKS